ncbi:MAG TPA: GNAT family N-acetyltransferase [Acidimicrobiales bacterium]
MRAAHARGDDAFIAYLTDSGDVAAAIESNVAGALLHMGRTGGGEERSDSEVAWTIGGSPIGYHNAVVRCDASPARAARLVEEWRDELEHRGLPGSWHLSPSMRPAGLADLLLAAGFDDGGDEPAMAADLRAVAEVDVPAVGGLVISPVRDPAALDAYRSVLASGFGEGPPEAEWVAAVFDGAGLHADRPWQHVVGWVGDEPVATVSTFVEGGVAGIYFVCTAPGARGRGIGAAITRAAMDDARAAGCSLAVLGASPMGHAVYRRLGFVDVFGYRLFEWAG